MAGLEDGDFLDDLVQANPVTATDPVTEGAAHLRLLKKVLQQTFPNFDEAVLLTPSQLNDAALKSVAQTISGVWQHDSNLNLLNNVSLQGQNSGATVNGGLARMNANNESEFGNATFPTRLQYFEDMFVSRSGVAIAQFTSGPGGGLLVTDTLGALSPVAKTGATETISGAWVFTAEIAAQSGLQVLNDIALRSVLNSGTGIEILKLTAADVLVIGSAGNVHSSILYSDSTIRHVVNGLDVGDWTERVNGSLLVRDFNGGVKKAGFRNPTAVGNTLSRALTQADEGTVLLVNGGGDNPVIYTAPVLESFTTLRIMCNQSSRILSGVGLVSFRFYDGGGAFIDVFDNGIDIAPGSVVELYYQSSNQLNVFGNGITAI